MQFEWDSAKSEATKKNRGVSFEDAEKVWDDPDLLVVPARTEKEEPRSAAIGKIGDKIHTVIFTQRDPKIRIISVRRARANEIKQYENK